MNYYNEFDPGAAQWLRSLIQAGKLPAGVVDERDIRLVQPAELKGYAQCHFFAGIGGWALALEKAGWDKDSPVWTGSCPCQPFSVCGSKKGTKDERHLWPEFKRLIADCRPPVVFGEQVASADGVRWLSGVRADLEACGYAVGAADLPAAGVWAPHIRQRLWWVADASESQLRQVAPAWNECRDGEDHQLPLWMADSNGRGRGEDGESRGLQEVHPGGADERLSSEGSSSGGGADGLAHASDPDRRPGECGQEEGVGTEEKRRRGSSGRRLDGGMDDAKSNGPEGGAPLQREHDGKVLADGRKPRSWDAFTVVPCSDGRPRRIEPGTFPLAHGVPDRVVKLRAYGNAIVPEVAEEFIRAYREVKAQ